MLDAVKSVFNTIFCMNLSHTIFWKIVSKIQVQPLHGSYCSRLQKMTFATFTFLCNDVRVKYAKIEVQIHRFFVYNISYQVVAQCFLLIIASTCFSLKDSQELRPKHVGAMINNNIVQQVIIKYYICNIVAWKMYNIKHRFFTNFYVILFYCVSTLLLWAEIAQLVTPYMLDSPGIESQWGWDFLHPTRPALGPT